MNLPLHIKFYASAAVAIVLMAMPQLIPIYITGTSFILFLISALVTHLYRPLFEQKAMHEQMKNIAQQYVLSLHKEKKPYMQRRGIYQPKPKSEVLSGQVAGQKCTLIFCYPSMACGGNGNIYSELQIWLDLENDDFSQIEEGDPQKVIQGLSESVKQKMNTMKNKRQKFFIAEGSLIFYINNPLLDKINIASYVVELAEIKAGILTR